MCVLVRASEREREILCVCVFVCDAWLFMCVIRCLFIVVAFVCVFVCLLA